ncbi:MAG TPA: HD domain-containing protein [bacterium]|nr:HD domain-containing protein [bacterium]HEX67680.1 HD domain-containing protein [bacterium]
MSEEVLKKVYEIFSKNGAEVYLVGGSVRDLLLKREINDYDFATPLPPEKVIEIFRKEGITTYPIGIEFGTVGVVIGEKEVQITTFRRKEKYPPSSRKPEVEFGGTIEEDLARRDFTINSMAITPQGELIDPFNGKEDLRRGILRTPLSPDISFTDDPLRMLRCFRFQSQLGFTIEENTYGAIRKHAFRIMFLSPERIQMEMDKLLLGDYVEKALKGLMETRLISFFLHELVPLENLHQSIELHHKDVWNHTISVVKNTPKVLLYRWTALLHDIAKPYVRSVENGKIHFYRHEELGARISFYILSRLKYPKDFIKKVCFLVSKHMRPALYNSSWTDSAVRRFIREMGENLEPLLVLAKADITSYRPERVKERLSLLKELEERVEALKSVREIKCPVDGWEIMNKYNIKPGPLVGKIKNLILEAVISGELPEKCEDKEIYFEYVEKKLNLKEELLKEKKDEV